MVADNLARGIAARAWASVRARAVTFEEFGATGVGDDRAAVQRAIDCAAANGIPKVTTRLPRLELWDPVRSAPLAGTLQQFHADRTLRIPACDRLNLDFAGARITLKGPAGGNRFPGQAVADGLWLGGFITVTGAVVALRIANLDCDGGFAGDTVNQADANLCDKGFLCQDIAGMGRLEMDNVALHGFAGEIMYDNSAAEHVSRDCHLYNSGHSCWNPNGIGRVTAYNLQAGRARQVAEVVGGKGHTYVGGRFYKCGSAGSTFIGGPEPSFGATYNDPVRRSDAPPPYVTFLHTRFEDFASYLYLGSYMRGSIHCTDAAVFIAPGFASAFGVKDIDLDIAAWADRQNGYVAVTVGGPASDDGSQPSNVNLRIHCGRTHLARANNRILAGGLQILNLVDAPNCQFFVDGISAYPFGALGTGLAGFTMPRVDLGPAASTLPLTAHELSFNADQVYTTQGPGVTLRPTQAGVFTLTIDPAPRFSHGQRFRFVHDGSGAADRVVRFPRDGQALRLNADRTLRRAGEYLELEYSAHGNVWVEAGYNGQGAGIVTLAGTGHTVGLGDAGGYLRFTSGAPATLTVPADGEAAFALGTTIEFEQAGAGTLTLAAAAGVTLASRGGDVTLAGQYAVGFIRKVAANSWVAGGDL